MNILHTSDWHLGRTLLGKKRDQEHEAFLSWLISILQQQHIDILLIAGDIFDSATPNLKAQSQYYQFLSQVAHTCCQHVVVIAGNHDSVAFLQAPQALLKALHIHVVAQAQLPEAEVLWLPLPSSNEAVIVGAVPYLRDRDVRSFEAGESIDTKNQKLLEGIQAHYRQVSDYAIAMQVKQRVEANISAPIVLMGHLFAAGGATVEGDGVRDLYVGSLLSIGADTFAEEVDYVALGHLHQAQWVAGQSRIRYSGSPIPMGFGELHHQKSVEMITLQEGKKAVHDRIIVPCFQALQKIIGDWQTISEQLRQLTQAHTSVWVEIRYQGSEVIPDLVTRVSEIVANSAVEVLRIEQPQLAPAIGAFADMPQNLAELNVEEVFVRCLEAYHIPSDEQPLLLALYSSVVESVLADETWVGRLNAMQIEEAHENS